MAAPPYHRGRIDSLDFIDDLHDDIASFLTRAHCEADILKYLDGQLIYSRPSWLDTDKWRDVPGSIYDSGEPRDKELDQDPR